VTKDGYAMAIIRGPVEYQAGADWRDPDRMSDQVADPTTAKSRVTDDEPLHTVRIDRDFSVGLREVSLREFIQFQPGFLNDANIVLSPTLDFPVNRVNWFMVAEYCNWLSDREGLDATEWCFLPNAEGNYAPGMTLAPDYLHRRGYRMPTEAEWEYVCRAGTSTRRYFGDCEHLLPQFVWYMDNSKEKVLSRPGTLKPNDLGAFDMLGNVLEWTIDANAGRPRQGTTFVIDSERGLEAEAEPWRILRGSHLFCEARYIRVTDVWTFRPISTETHYGLRLARTLKTHPASQPNR
jgi:hypothetical protein